MKLITSILVAATVFAMLQAAAQGTFVYDQQSSDEAGAMIGGGVYINQSAAPAQSFVPSLTGVGFIRLYINDNNPQDLLGTSLLVNLRSNSLDGPILATSAIVPIPNGSLAPVNFFFGGNTPVTPGQTYYFDVQRQGGVDSWTSNIAFYNYASGTLYYGGGPDASGRDMWFRSGLYVPEPSTSVLLLAGLAYALRYRRRS